MELYVCGFNAHHQLTRDSSDDIFYFKKILCSPHINVRCALWSSTVVENDVGLVHGGFCSSGEGPLTIEGPSTRNIKKVFGDTRGVLGALTTDGSLYLFQDKTAAGEGLELKKHHFSDDSFIESQNLAIDHIAITENGKVCIATGKLQCFFDSHLTHLQQTVARGGNSPMVVHRFKRTWPLNQPSHNPPQSLNSTSFIPLNISPPLRPQH